MNMQFFEIKVKFFCGGWEVRSKFLAKGGGCNMQIWTGNENRKILAPIPLSGFNSGYQCPQGIKKGLPKGFENKSSKRVCFEWNIFAIDFCTMRNVDFGREVGSKCENIQLLTFFNIIQHIPLGFE